MRKDLNYWEENASEDYLHTPLSVLKYITVLEGTVERLQENSEKARTLLQAVLCDPEGTVVGCPEGDVKVINEALRFLDQNIKQKEDGPATDN